MISWNHIVFLLSALLILFMIWNEWKFKSRSLVLRLLASVLAVVSMGLILMPAFNETFASHRLPVLLTKGYDPDSVRLFLSSNNAGAQYLTVPELLSDDVEHLHSIHVFGYGFTKDELDRLPVQKMIFHPAIRREGISSVHWPHWLNQGDSLKINGILESKGPAMIRLCYLGKTVDSTYLDSAGPHIFELGTIPAFSGRLNFELLVLKNSDTLEHEQVPVEIAAADTIKILFLNSTPDFEQKFLSNWLESKGSEMNLRTEISRNKYSSRFLNSKAIGKIVLSRNYLGKFDLVVTDIGSLSSLGGSELGVIRHALHDDGVGMLLEANGAIAPSLFVSGWFPVLQLKDSEETRLSFPGLQPPGLLTLTEKNPAMIESKKGNRPVITDSRGRIFAASRIYGSGKIVCITLDQSYKWFLSGNKQGYKNFWSRCIREAGKEKQPAIAYSIKEQLPAIHQPLTINMLQKDTLNPDVHIEGVKLHFEQDPDLQEMYVSSYWPTAKGWHFISDEKQQGKYFYVFAAGDWLPVSENQKLRVTAAALGSHFQKPGLESVPAYRRSEWQKVFLYLVFILSTAFLWLRRGRDTASG